MSISEKDYIVVNATALDRSGALSILKQFIDNIPKDKHKWLIFSPENVKLSSDNPNVRIESIFGVKPMYKRLTWDACGIKKWLKKNNINPIAAVSLQNTGFQVGKKVPNFIYYHQPLPFFPNRWNPFNSKQRTLWFYKHIYPFFVKLFLKKGTKIFVQLDFIKEGFKKRFHHPDNQIEIYSPAVNIPSLEYDTLSKKPKELNLFYPASSYFYKNHKVLEEALSSTPEFFKILFTLPKNSYNETRIDCIDVQPYDKICELYYSCDALLFPSYIETFGLPLLEAALTGMPIIAADLPYAREVLNGYKGVTFVKYDNPKAWAKAIDNIKKGQRYTPINIEDRPSWSQLFQSIIKEL